MKTLLFAISMVLFSSCYYHHGEEIEVVSVFKNIQEMPTFPGCDSIVNINERIICSDELIEEFISKNLIYPEQAIRNGIEGEILVQFIVDDEGKLKAIEIAEDELGWGCDKAALDVVEKMPNWNPGIRLGEPVYVQIYLPVEFKL